MHAFVVVLNHAEHLEPLLEEMMKAGISGATVIESRGMARVLFNENTPLFGMLRSIVNESRAENKTIFTVIEDSKIEELRKIVNKVTGGISIAGNGIMFATPLSFVEGMAEGK